MYRKGKSFTLFTTISKSGFQNPDVEFINLNVTEFDSFKHGAIPLVGDAKITLEHINKQLGNYKVDAAYKSKVERLNKEWDTFVDSIYEEKNDSPAFQGEVIGAVNSFMDPKDIVLCAAGSLPGDLHKLWRTQDPKGFHLEYGYSCMGYEIAGGLGAKMARPDSEVYVMVGDGSYLMMSQEIVTAIQEKVKMTIILLNNDGYSSIGSLSNAVGSEGFGTYYRYRNEETNQLDGGKLPIDYTANAASMGAYVIKTKNVSELKEALNEAKSIDRTTVIYIDVNRKKGVPGFTWWDVPIAEVSEKDAVKKSLETYTQNKKKQKYYL